MNGSCSLEARLLAASLRLPGTADRFAPLLHEAALRSAPTPSFRLGRSRATLLTTPEDVAHVLVGAAPGFDKPERMTSAGMRAAAGSGVLTSTSSEAGPLRARTAAALRIDAISAHAEAIRQRTAGEAERWLERGRLALHEDIPLLVRRISLDVLVGEDWAGLVPNLEEALRPRRARMSSALRARVDPLRKRVLDGELEAGLAAAVARARRRGVTSSVLERLASENEDAEWVVVQIRTLLLSATETVSAAVSWTLAELAEMPSLVETVRAEVGGGDDGATPRRRQTAAIVDETLRLHPPVARFHRVALRESRLPSGSIVPAGHTVVISPYVLGRMRALWPEPDRFDPSRFEASTATHDKYAYLPFGAGHRVCIARTLALMQTRLMVGEICSVLDPGPLAAARSNSEPIRYFRQPRYAAEAAAAQ